MDILNTSSSENDYRNKKEPLNIELSNLSEISNS